MTIEDIMALDISGIAADNCVLILWTTWPHLTLAAKCIESYGFVYKTGFPWVKMKRADIIQMGTGYHNRACSEPVLIATRGTGYCPPPSKREAGIIIEPEKDLELDYSKDYVLESGGGTMIHQRGRHSAKPDEQYRRAEAYKGPYVEVFSRYNPGLFEPHPGWTYLGNEIDGLDITDALKRYKAMPQTDDPPYSVKDIVLPK